MATEILALIAAISSAVTAIFAYRYTRSLAKAQTLHSLIKDYSSEELGNAVKKLWDFYREDCEKNSENLLEKWAEKKEGLDSCRRKATHFYTQLAFCYVSKLIDVKKLKKIWFERDLKIIEDILLPIEEQMLKERSIDPEKEPPIMKELLKIYSKDYIKREKTMYWTAWVSLFVIGLAYFIILVLN